MNFITMENENITASVAERCDDTLKEKKNLTLPRPVVFGKCMC